MQTDTRIYIDTSEHTQTLTHTYTHTLTHTHTHTHRGTHSHHSERILYRTDVRKGNMNIKIVTVGCMHYVCIMERNVKE